SAIDIFLVAVVFLLTIFRAPDCACIVRRLDDCLPAEECCYDVFTSPPATIGSYCAPKGSCGLAVGCDGDADCAGSTGPCIAQLCRGDVLQTCGLLPTEACPP